MTNRAPQILRRSSAVTLCALASLFLAACGGGGASGAGGSQLDSAVPFSERPASGAQSGDQSTNEPDQTASDDERAESYPTTDDSAAGDDDQVADSGSNDDDSFSGSSSSESNSGYDEVTTDDDSLADSDERVRVEDGSVTLEWYRPDYRENGDLIRDGEIGGYEVRYRQVGAEEAESVVLDGEWEIEYQLEGLEEGEYEFSIAAYDTNGLYSELVSISPLQ